MNYLSYVTQSQTSNNSLHQQGHPLDRNHEGRNLRAKNRSFYKSLTVLAQRGFQIFTFGSPFIGERANLTLCKLLVSLVVPPNIVTFKNCEGQGPLQCSCVHMNVDPRNLTKQGLSFFDHLQLPWQTPSVEGSFLRAMGG